MQDGTRAQVVSCAQAPGEDTMVLLQLDGGGLGLWSFLQLRPLDRGDVERQLAK